MAKVKSKDEKTIEYLETRYMYESRERMYIANEETNMVWDETDVPDVITAWNNNWSMAEIENYLGADRWEMLLLMADLIQKGKIDGNIHIFKPKGRKEPESMIKIYNGHSIRVVTQGKAVWYCLKDIWVALDRDNEGYKKRASALPPDEKAIYKTETGGGPQKAIFITMKGLSRIEQTAKNIDRKKIKSLIEGLNNV